jgi:hypothetical protein
LVCNTSLWHHGPKWVGKCLLSIRHTTAHAIAQLNPPYPATLVYIRAANFPHHPQGYSPSYSRYLVTLCLQAGLTESLAELLESVLILAADLNAWYDDPESPLDALDVQNFSCSLECLLLAWIHERVPLITPLEDALCVALIIFTVRTTEALKRPSDAHHLHFTASKRLESALNCTTRAEWQSCPDLLLWILTIGSISADCSVESAWFVHQSSLACAEFNIDSAEALLKRMSACGWVNYKLDESVRHLWNKIVQIRLVSYTLIEPIQSLAHTWFISSDSNRILTHRHRIWGMPTAHLGHYKKTSRKTNLPIGAPSIGPP